MGMAGPELHSPYLGGHLARCAPGCGCAATDVAGQGRQLERRGRHMHKPGKRGTEPESACRQVGVGGVEHPVFCHLFRLATLGGELNTMNKFQSVLSRVYVAKQGRRNGTGTQCRGWGSPAVEQHPATHGAFGVILRGQRMRGDCPKQTNRAPPPATSS